MLPTRTEFQNALMNPQLLGANILPPGQLDRNALGLPLTWAGNYAVVFRYRAMDGSTWAIRCLTAELPNVQEHYEAVAAFLQQQPNPHFVEFRFHPSALRLAGGTFPLLLMRWVEGETLKQYLERRLLERDRIETLAHSWRAMMQTLTKQGIAHGDLQHANVIVTGALGQDLKLVDYDSLVLPTRKEQLDTLAGLPTYQHPLRRLRPKERRYSALDAFSSLVIYLSLRALTEKPELWSLFNVGPREGLLFEPEDFLAPQHSKLFAALDQCSEEIRGLANCLALMCRRADLHQFPALERLITEGPSALPAGGPSFDGSAWATRTQGARWLTDDEDDWSVVETTYGAPPRVVPVLSSGPTTPWWTQVAPQTLPTTPAASSVPAATPKPAVPVVPRPAPRPRPVVPVVPRSTPPKQSAPPVFSRAPSSPPPVSQAPYATGKSPDSLIKIAGMFLGALVILTVLLDRSPPRNSNVYDFLREQGRIPNIWPAKVTTESQPGSRIVQWTLDVSEWPVGTIVPGPSIQLGQLTSSGEAHLLNQNDRCWARPQDLATFTTSSTQQQLAGALEIAGTCDPYSEFVLSVTMGPRVVKSPAFRILSEAVDGDAPTSSSAGSTREVRGADERASSSSP